MAVKPAALFLLLSSLLALIVCPHSKVEESFNLQATHDLFYHGVEPAWKSYQRSMDQEHTCDAGAEEQGSCSADSLSYDHIKFPGVVPRTFFGAFVLSYVAKAIAFIIPKQILDVASRPMLVQFVVRLELLLLNCMACIRLARAVDSCFGELARKQKRRNSTELQSATIGTYYLLITAAQFHIPFYSSRLLPNTFALLLVTNAYADWFRGRHKLAATYLVFTAGIFRCDMLLLLFTVGLCMLIRRQLTILEALSVGVATGVIGLLMTVPLDSVLWGRPIWPEFEVWWFNTVDNRSSEWGEMVWHWYFSRALPKGLMCTALLIPLAFVRIPELVAKMASNKSNQMMQVQQLFDCGIYPYFAPVLAFVVMYSFLPHKEIRFIFPAIPMFNVGAAYGMSRLHQCNFYAVTNEEQQTSNWVCKLMYLCGLGTIMLTSVASMLFLRISTENYPGGEALLRLRQYLLNTIPQQNDGKSGWNSVRLHVDVAAAMTGVSLFGQRHASIRQVGSEYYEGPFLIDKSGYEEENKADESEMHPFTHLLTEKSRVDGFRLIDVIKGHPRLDIRKLRIATDDAIFIYEKDDWRH